MGFERTVITSRVESTERVVVVCSDCRGKIYTHLATANKVIELHRKRNPTHATYTIGIKA